LAITYNSSCIDNLLLLDRTVHLQIRIKFLAPMPEFTWNFSFSFSFYFQLLDSLIPWMRKTRSLQVVNGIFMIYYGGRICMQELDNSCFDLHMVMFVSRLGWSDESPRTVLFITSVGVSSSLAKLVVYWCKDFLRFFAWRLFFPSTPFDLRILKQLTF